MTLGASAAVAAFTLSVAPSAAQVPRAAEVGGYTASLGQPKVWHWQLGLGSGAWNAGPGSSVMLRAEFGTYHSLVNPVASFAEIGLEGYAGSRSHAADGGLRAILRVPYLGMGVGADYNIHDGRTDLLYTAYTPVRRGGVFQHGTMLRLNWYPFRSGWTIGVTAATDPYGNSWSSPRTAVCRPRTDRPTRPCWRPWTACVPRPSGCVGWWCRSSITMPARQGWPKRAPGTR